jgi:hypothetical protein
MNKKLVDELRRMFIDGATPSQLMNHIAQHHKGDARLHFVIKDYFREAFRVPLLRNVLSEECYYPNPRHAHFIRDVVPEMIERINDWNTTNLEGSWLNGLSVKSLSDHTERLKSTPFDGLTRVWGDLREEEKLSIVRKVALKDYYWDVVKSLAMMAERLQQKIVELEQRLNEKHPVTTGSRNASEPANS